MWDTGATSPSQERWRRQTILLRGHRPNPTNQVKRGPYAPWLFAQPSLFNALSQSIVSRALLAALASGGLPKGTTDLNSLDQCIMHCRMCCQPAIHPQGSRYQGRLIRARLCDGKARFHGAWARFHGALALSSQTRPQQYSGIARESSRLSE